jgi:hypothetical protein
MQRALKAVENEKPATPLTHTLYTPVWEPDWGEDEGQITAGKFRAWLPVGHAWQDDSGGFILNMHSQPLNREETATNAGHMVFGPAEAFTPEQYAALYDVNVLGTQRVNRVALPILRRQGRGLVVWVSSTSTRGGTPPWLAPYFAANAGMDSLAVSYAGELARWGIETSIIVPGAYTNGTNHFAHAGAPADTARAAEYADGPTGDIPDIALKWQGALEPPDGDASEVAEAIARVVDMPFGKRPFRVHIDPSQDGAEVVNGVADRVRAELLRRIGLADLLHPTA